MTLTPTGEPGIRITCTDPAHRHAGAALIRHTEDPIHQDTACKLIDLARHPLLSRAASVQRFGPWPTD